jgi:hypothetical protein
MMNRREALAALAIPISAGAPSLIAQAATAREPAKHVIDRLEVFRVRVNQRGRLGGATDADVKRPVWDRRLFSKRRRPQGPDVAGTIPARSQGPKHLLG